MKVHIQFNQRLGEADLHDIVGLGVILNAEHVHQRVGHQFVLGVRKMAHWAVIV